MYLCGNDQQVVWAVCRTLLIVDILRFEAKGRAGATHLTRAVHVAELIEVQLILGQVIICHKKCNQLNFFFFCYGEKCCLTLDNIKSLNADDKELHTTKWMTRPTFKISMPFRWLFLARVPAWLHPHKCVIVLCGAPPNLEKKSKGKHSSVCRKCSKAP